MTRLHFVAPGRQASKFLFIKKLSILRKAFHQFIFIRLNSCRNNLICLLIHLVLNYKPNSRCKH
jgi:hypothetical protein